ncbi:unnamed protein product [Timema podura]|uniref:Uncharacterized protein n=1 Tax=Timema podura TaxID=61482 RepID=A0ABN7NS62_TIMPD|nr:unnamed protein product [Timema podura]
MERIERLIEESFNNPGLAVDWTAKDGEIELQSQSGVLRRGNLQPSLQQSANILRLGLVKSRFAHLIQPNRTTNEREPHVVCVTGLDVSGLDPDRLNGNAIAKAKLITF